MYIGNCLVLRLLLICALLLSLFVLLHKQIFPFVLFFTLLIHARSKAAENLVFLLGTRQFLNLEECFINAELVPLYDNQWSESSHHLIDN